MAIRGLGESQALAYEHEKCIGDLIADTYRITRQIGAGGSSQVFEAEHVRLAKPFAVKLLRADIHQGKKTAQRFRREAQAIGRIDSPHVVSVVDCGELADRTPYLVMELLRGEDLRTLLESQRQRQLPLRRAVRLIIEACHGLSAVHAAGLVHRDIKPENLFITRRPSGEDWCKLLDFGVAKMQSTLTTAEGTILGTARYMAPEQFAASADVEPTADVYALGAVLYECLSGQPVHAGETVHQTMYQAMNLEPAPLGSVCPTLPQQIAVIVHRCLAKQPSARPRSTAELARQLEAALSDDSIDPAARTLSEDSPALQRATPPNATTRPARSWLIPTAFACVSSLLVGFGVGSSRPSPTARVEVTPPPATEPEKPIQLAAKISDGSQLSQAPETEAPRAPSIPVPRSSAPRSPTPPRPNKPALAGSSLPTSLNVGDIDVANPYAK